MKTVSQVKSKTKGVEVTKDLMTVSEAADFLNISRFTVYRMIKEGEIQATKIRGSIRIFGDALAQYVNTNII